MKNLMIKSAVAMVSVAVSAAAMANVATSQLLVVASKSATITKVKAHEYSVTVSSPRINYFTDRPARAVGQYSVKQFMNVWYKGKNSFAKDNPNAAFVAISKKDQRREAHSFVMMDKVKRGHKTLSFLLTGVDRPLRLVPGNYTDAVFFIDNFAGCHASHGNPHGCR